MVPHQPNIALGYCVKFPRCILIYDAGGLFISYSDNTTICKFRRNIGFPILLFVWSLRRTRQMLRTHILTGFHATQIQMLCQYKFAGIKFREFTGVQPYQYTDGEVADFDSKGIAVYREVNGYGEVSNSLCTNQEHEDSRVIMDHVVYNLANNLNIMFRNENVNTKTARNLIDFYSTAAMDYLKDDLLMVEEYLNKSGEPQ